jgi:hypothetical protein
MTNSFIRKTLLCVPKFPVKRCMSASVQNSKNSKQEGAKVTNKSKTQSVIRLYGLSKYSRKSDALSFIQNILNSNDNNDSTAEISSIHPYYDDFRNPTGQWFLQFENVKQVNNVVFSFNANKVKLHLFSYRLMLLSSEQAQRFIDNCKVRVVVPLVPPLLTKAEWDGRSQKTDWCTESEFTLDSTTVRLHGFPSSYGADEVRP